jgi:hypothetical protein
MVRILHAEPGPGAGPLEAWVAAARAALAERHAAAFTQAGADDVAIVRGPPDDVSFGARVRSIVTEARPAGLVVLGSGAIPLARDADVAAFVATAATLDRVALANNRYSADIVAISCAEALAELPDLPSDNALPRWLEEVAGYRVQDLRRSWRLGIDVDGPLELAVLEATPPMGVDLGRVRERLASVRAVARGRRSELLLAGRMSVRTLAWLERGVPCRIRALIEERGLRAASLLAQRETSNPRHAQRAVATALGMVLDAAGPDALGTVCARLGDAAIIDSRVLLAHRLGADERLWPPAEERFASDLLLPDRIQDHWLRDLTEAAVTASIPVLLGGHTMVDGGLRLFLGRTRPKVNTWT